MHGLSSPAFPYKEHSQSKYWGMHKSVAFDRVKAMEQYYDISVEALNAYIEANNKSEVSA